MSSSSTKSELKKECLYFFRVLFRFIDLAEDLVFYLVFMASSKSFYWHWLRSSFKTVWIKNRSCCVGPCVRELVVQCYLARFTNYYVVIPDRYLSFFSHVLMLLEVGGTRFRLPFSPVRHQPDHRVQLYLLYNFSLNSSIFSLIFPNLSICQR